ncbi:hypothetical protein BCEP27_30513 [Burkholderia cepacia]
MRTFAFFIAFHPFNVAGPAKRHPDSPGERLSFTVNGDFDAAENEEIFFVDYTVVAAQITTHLSLGDRYFVVA